MGKIKYCLAFVLIYLLQSCMVSKHPNMAYFDNPAYDYKDVQFMSVNVPMILAKPFVKKALREEGAESEELVNLIKKVSKIKVLTVENGKPEMVKDFSAYLASNSYQDWITIYQDGKKISLQTKQNGDVIKKLMLTVQDDKELVFVDVTGKFTSEDISRLINAAEKKK